MDDLLSLRNLLGESERRREEAESRAFEEQRRREEAETRANTLQEQAQSLMSDITVLLVRVQDFVAHHSTMHSAPGRHPYAARPAINEREVYSAWVEGSNPLSTGQPEPIDESNTTNQKKNCKCPHKSCQGSAGYSRPYELVEHYSSHCKERVFCEVCKTDFYDIRSYLVHGCIGKGSEIQKAITKSLCKELRRKVRQLLGLEDTGKRARDEDHSISRKRRKGANPPDDAEHTDPPQSVPEDPTQEAIWNAPASDPTPGASLSVPVDLNNSIGESIEVPLHIPMNYGQATALTHSAHLDPPIYIQTLSSTTGHLDPPICVQTVSANGQDLFFDAPIYSMFRTLEELNP